MKATKVVALATQLILVGLLLASCATAAPAIPPSKASQAPRTGESPADKPSVAPTAPSPTGKPAAGQPRYGGILKHAANQDEPTFDLHVTGRNLASEQAGLCYDGLLQYDPEDGRRIVPDLAESYQVASDGKKVTFLLRKNVRWHDGKTFTSEDVKFNFDRWMKPPQGVVIARKEIVAAVERVETPDANTVDVYLKYPTPFFIAGIAMGSSGVMLPPQYLKDHKTMEFNILGTGPFKLKKYNRGASLEYVKNEDYFVPGRPYLNGIIQYMVPDEAARFAAFRTGQVRTIFWSSVTITSSHAEILRKDMSDKVNVDRFPAMGHGLVYLNTTRPPFNDLRVRQAVDLAIDRNKILDVMERRGEITGPMNRGPWALPDDELLKRPGYRGVTTNDIEKAKALLAEASYPKGFQIEATINDAYTKQTVFVQDQLKAVGIDVSIKMVDMATMEKRYVARDFALSVYQAGHPIDEPDILLAFWITEGGRNYSGFTDKQVDAWYQEQSRTMEVAKRKEIVLNMQRRILDLTPTPLLWRLIYEAPYWKCVRGFYPAKNIAAHNNVKRQDVWLAEGCQ